jgi:processive 1,2-diacylglycerol beta-glucosyltransferase
MDKISLALFTPQPPEHALPILRVSAAAAAAGLQVDHQRSGHGADPGAAATNDLVIIQRDLPRDERLYTEVVRQARAAKRPVVYEIDDLLMELPPEHPNRITHQFTTAVAPILEALMEADLVTVSTAALRQEVLTYNPNVRLLPNCLVDSIWPMRAPVPNEKERPVVIGYMGSPTHSPDLDFLAPVLVRLARRYGDRVNFQFWGVEPPASLIGFSGVRYSTEVMFDYAAFAAWFLQQPVDIFVAPLVDNRFNRCKSGIKFLEYSALGAPGVFSRLPPFEEVVIDGQTGFLAETLDAWEEHLSRLVESPELRIEMARAAQADIRAKRTTSHQAHLWRETYADLLSGRDLKPANSTPLKIVRQARAAQQAADQFEIDQLKSENENYARNLSIAQREVHKLEENLRSTRSSPAYRFAARLFPSNGAWEKLGDSFNQIKADTQTLFPHLRGFSLVPGPDLTETPFIGYRVSFKKSGLRGLLVAPVMNLPVTTGSLGIEIVSPQMETLVQTFIYAADLRDYQPALIEFSPLAQTESGFFELRIFARNTDEPITVLELQGYTLGGLGRQKRLPFIGMII